MSVQEYVRHAKSLLARLVTSPPSEADKTVALFEGLDPVVKQAAPVDPRTGRAWKTFDDLAEHIITLEQQAPRKLQRDRTVDVLTRGFKKPSPRVTFAAPLQGIRTQNPRDPRFRPVPSGPPQFSTAGKGGRPGDRGAEQANKRPRGDQQTKHPGSKTAMQLKIAELNSIIGQLAPGTGN